MKMDFAPAAARYQFEDVPSDALDASHDATSLSRFISRLPVSGRLLFAAPPPSPPTPRDAGDIVHRGGAGRAAACVLAAWRLAASHSGLWTDDHEVTAGWLVTVTVDVSRAAGGGRRGRTAAAARLLAAVAAVLPLDARRRHLLVCALRLTHAAVAASLTDSRGVTAWGGIASLHASYALMRYLQRRLVRCYGDPTQEVGAGRREGAGQASVQPEVTDTQPDYADTAKIARRYDSR